MNRLEALMYCVAASGGAPDPGLDRFDLRLAAWLAAMDQMGKEYAQVNGGDWWNGRCQLGLLVGEVFPAAAFGATVPTGTGGRPRPADADDFCDPGRRPSPEAVTEALRLLGLMRIGAGLPERKEVFR